MASHVYESVSADNLHAGGQIPIVTEAVTIALGQNLARGAAIGKILYDLGVPVADPGNTGDGTCVAALPSGGEEPEIGAYTATCEVIADAGPPAVVAQFRIVTPRTPQGVLVFADGTAQVVDGVELTITQGATPFAVDDVFTFALAAGSGECVQLDSTAVDGSQFIHGVLSEAVDASLAAKPAIAYTAGEFAADHVVFAGADTAATFQDAARAKGILFRDTAPA